jgi:hypothetical protein
MRFSISYLVVLAIVNGERHRTGISLCCASFVLVDIRLVNYV